MENQYDIIQKTFRIFFKLNLSNSKNFLLLNKYCLYQMIYLIFFIRRNIENNKKNYRFFLCR